MAITAAKRQEVAALRYAVLAFANFATLFGSLGESCFLSDKVAKWYKRLKAKSEDPKPRNRPLPPKNVLPPLLHGFR